jgi:hypothetical protein
MTVSVTVAIFFRYSFIQSKRWIYRFNVISVFFGIWEEEERPCIYSGYSFVTICNSECWWLRNTSLTSAVVSQGMAWPLGVSWSLTDILQLKIHWAKAEETNFPKILEPHQNSRSQEDDMKQGPTTIRGLGTKFRHSGELALGIFATLV